MVDPISKEAGVTEGQSWTDRVARTVNYYRYSAADAGGRPSIFFKFEFPIGDELSQNLINEELKKYKFIDNKATGFKLRKDRVHGWAWRLPDTPLGHHTAAMVEESLKDFARKIDYNPARQTRK